jgi:hypothetical protein
MLVFNALKLKKKIGKMKKRGERKREGGKQGKQLRHLQIRNEENDPCTTLTE